MKWIKKTVLLINEIRVLDFQQIWHWFIYRGLLHSGYFRKKMFEFKSETPSQFPIPAALPISMECPVSEGNYQNYEKLIDTANRILGNEYPAFGASWLPLIFDGHMQEFHWTHAEKIFKNDIKWIWEPARFTWGILLARAYLINKNERYVSFFWEKFDEFQRVNSVNFGLNWVSGQEIALRLIAFTFCVNIFRNSQTTTKENIESLLAFAYQHAQRIPLTFSYAIAQKNNHLVSEAAGLITAAYLFPDDRNAKKWQHQGITWMNRIIETHFYPNGSYLQQSTNYHRLVLQLLIWVELITRNSNNGLNFSNQATLFRAIMWLYHFTDSISGEMANLGHNDGANIFPTVSGNFRQAADTVQLASFVFLGEKIYASKEWDDLLNLFASGMSGQGLVEPSPCDFCIKVNQENWSTLRAVKYKARPAHADQLHIDIWRSGKNIICDQGTFSYNAPPPWDNRLGATRYHNTISIDLQDQMLRTGKFRWQNWSEAEISELKLSTQLSSKYYIKKSKQVFINRRLTATANNGWLIDDMLSNPNKTYIGEFVYIHWHVNAINCSFENNLATFRSDSDMINIAFEVDDMESEMVVFFGGKKIYGDSFDLDSLSGWYSPTYGVKQPIYSLCWRFKLKPHLKWRTLIAFD